MNLKDLPRVQELQAALERAHAVLCAFEKHTRPTVRCTASTTDHDFHRGESVELAGVPKSVAVSAARREVSKIVAMLQQLGVTIDGETDEETVGLRIAAQMRGDAPLPHDFRNDERN